MQWTQTPGLTHGRVEYLARLDGLLLGQNPSEGIIRDGLFLHPDLDFALEFPKECTTLNTHVAVVARSPEGKAQISIWLQAGETSPDEAAQTFFDEVAKEVSVEVGNSESLEIADLPAHRAVAVVFDSGDLAYLDLTWIAHHGRMIRLIGASPPRFFDDYRQAFAATAGSFRPLAAGESESIQDTRLRSKTSQPGETLESFGTRTQNAWSVEETAVANALQRDEVLPTGALVKVAILEPHTTLDD